jgi:hypothetical protein
MINIKILFLGTWSRCHHGLRWSLHETSFGFDSILQYETS